MSKTAYYLDKGTYERKTRRNGQGATMTIQSNNAVDTCIGKIDMLDAAIRQYHISKEQLDVPSRKLEDIPEDILARFVAVA